MSNSGSSPASYLFDGPHWRVEPVASLDVFLTSLSVLGIESGLLSLAAGHPTSEIRQWLYENSVPQPEMPALPIEFHGAPVVRAVPPVLAALAEFATREPCPVLAIHLCVCTPDGSRLEWYDLPSDPISISPSIQEERVAALAAACGVEYGCESGSK